MTRREQAQATSLPVIIHQRSEHLLIDLLEDYGGTFTLDTLTELERDFIQAQSDNTSSTWTLRNHLTDGSLRFLENFYFNLLHDGVPLEDRMLTDEERRNWKDIEPSKVFKFFRYCVTSQNTGFALSTSASLAQQMSSFTFSKYDLTNVFDHMMRIQTDLMDLAGTRVNEEDAEEIKKCLNKWEQTHNQHVYALDLITKIRARKPKSVQDIISAIFEHGVTARKYLGYLIPPTVQQNNTQNNSGNIQQPLQANVPSVNYLLQNRMHAQQGHGRHTRGSRNRGKGKKPTQGGGVPLVPGGVIPPVVNVPQMVNVPQVQGLQPNMGNAQTGGPASMQGGAGSGTGQTHPNQQPQQAQPFRGNLRNVVNSPFPEANGVNDPCRVCGSTKDTKPQGTHGPDNCPFKHHPNANHTTLPWAVSNQGLQWKMLQPKGSLWIPRGWQIINGVLHPYDGPSRPGKHPGAPPPRIF
jgi:hypothetical protein